MTYTTRDPHRAHAHNLHANSPTDCLSPRQIPISMSIVSLHQFHLLLAHPSGHSTRELVKENESKLGKFLIQPTLKIQDFRLELRVK